MRRLPPCDVYRYAIYALRKAYSARFLVFFFAPLPETFSPCNSVLSVVKPFSATGHLL